MNKQWVVDTNFVYDHLQSTFGQFEVVLMSTVRQELDKHKTSPNQDLVEKATIANRFIFENYDKFIHDIGEYNPETILGADYSSEVMDNRIIACAKENDYGILTGDLNLYVTAKSFGIEVRNINENVDLPDEYEGFKEVDMTMRGIQNFLMNHLNENIFELYVNEYLVLNDELGNSDLFVWTGETHERVRRSLRFSSTDLEEFKARDKYQLMAMDSIIRNDLTMITGLAGTAKTLIALSYAFQELNSRKCDKVILITNNLPTRDAFYNGLLKGSLYEKLMSSNIGNMLGSKLGSKDKVEQLVFMESLEIIPLSDVRGWEAPKDSIVIISEAQNMTRDNMKLALQRIPDDCKVIIEGDNLTQLDRTIFSGSNNGMRAMSEVFKGQEYFGQVKLQKIYRGKIAKQAELLGNN